MTLRWRVAVLDSGWSGAAVETARFVLDGEQVTTQPMVADELGHGTRVTSIIESASKRPALLIGQVLDARGVSTPAALAAAILWATERRCHLVHLSVGLAADRAVLREAIAAAIDVGTVIVAAVPARGRTVFPAAYPGVLQATGDARCSAEDLSHLSPGRFGGATRYGTSGGASIGAAHVTKAILEHCAPGSAEAMIETRLAGLAKFQGRERRHT